MAARAGEARVLLFGESPAAGIRATDVTLDERGRASFTLHAGGARPIRLAVTGRHQVSNALAAAAVGLWCGLDLDGVAAALGEIGIRSSRRMDVFDRPDGVTVIDDSYNANPSSAAAALRALAAMSSGRRTTAVLGYMAELGAQEVAGHEEIGRLAAELGVDRLVAVADNAAPILDGARAVEGWTGEAHFAADQQAAIKLLTLEPGDVVLVKGSRYRTWDVADALRPEGVRP
jgi:UDP-N-acetylmuramoyl-tripeptide--D-alanyl-D-alanine ligase